MSPIEIILIVFLILLLFGASRLPKMGRNLGQGLRGFKHELSDGLGEDEDANDRRDREVVPREMDREGDANDRRDREVVPRETDREAVPRAYDRQ